MKSKIFYALFLVCISFLFVEFGLRALGQKPRNWHSVGRGLSDGLTQIDDTLGWVSTPALLRNVAQGDAGVGVYRTGDTGARICDDDVAADAPIVLVLGGSFAHGTSSLSNEDTFTCKLQRRFKNFRFLNYGVVAFGTYQSMLMLERQIAKLQNVAVVLYGFVSFHESRNINHWFWNKGLSEATGRRVSIPYASIDSADRFVRHPPEAFPRIRASEWSALAATLEVLLAKNKSRPRISRGKETTVEIASQMQDVASSNGAIFYLVYLHAYKQAKESYLQSFASKSVDTLDCEFSAEDLEHTYQLPSNGHPNETVNQFWADCIAREFNALQTPQHGHDPNFSTANSE